MGRLLIVNFASLDGVIQGPLSADEDRDGGFDHGGWVVPYADDVVAGVMRDVTVGASALLLGRRSYEILTAAWAHADPAEPAVAAMNRMPKYVASRSPDVPLPWENSHRVGADVASEVADLTARTDGDVVVFGSGDLICGLLEHDLVDEIRLLQFPVLLGRGKRMFDERVPRTGFGLAEVGSAPSGVVLLTYRRPAA